MPKTITTLGELLMDQAGLEDLEIDHAYVMNLIEGFTMGELLDLLDEWE